MLKIANPVFAEAELDLQNRAMVHLAERMSVGIPLPCPALDGSEIIAVERAGATYLVRLVTFVEGTPLVDTHLSPPILRSLGRIAGELVRALESFEHPAADRVMQWDPRHVGAVVEALAPHIAIPAGTRSWSTWPRGRRRRWSGSSRRSPSRSCTAT